MNPTAQSEFDRRQNLQTFPQCLSCLEGLAETMSTLASDGDPRLKARVLSAAQEAFSRNQEPGATSPEMVNRIVRAVKLASQMADPYRDFKDQEAAAARQACARACQLMGSDLASLVSLAALGNSLDFFKPPAQAMAEAEAGAASGVRFQRNDTRQLQSALERGLGLVLYFTDNTGEIFFDLPLYDYLSQRAQRVVLVVKGGPALNDLTRGELLKMGLDERFAQVVDTGSDGVGVEWDKVSGQLKGLLPQADLIVSKGMANLESICAQPLPAPVFFILQAKCQPMRDFLGAKLESYWAVWRRPQPSEDRPATA
jgi:damage-control phosphatase, subfamily I